MKQILILVMCLVSAPAFAAQGVPTACSASAASVTQGTTVTLTDTITTAPSWAPAGYRAHFEWLGKLKLLVKYGNEADNTKSVVTVDTTKLPVGTYKAIGRLELLSQGAIVGYGKCSASFTVTY